MRRRGGQEVKCSTCEAMTSSRNGPAANTIKEEYAGRESVRAWDVLEILFEAVGAWEVVSVEPRADGVCAVVSALVLDSAVAVNACFDTTPTPELVPQSVTIGEVPSASAVTLTTCESTALANVTRTPILPLLEACNEITAISCSANPNCPIRCSLVSSCTSVSCAGVSWAI